MALSPGTRIGSYEVRAALGAGGMGEVYRAHDATLNRDVAIKVLPEAVARDPERLARFQREARSLAALNHPNIAHIHGLEMTGATPVIVMELVEGPTLHLAADTDSIVAWRGFDIYFARGGGQTTWPGPVLFRIPSAGGPEERLFDAPAGCAEALRLGPAARTVVCALDESRLDIRLVDGLGGG